MLSRSLYPHYSFPPCEELVIVVRDQSLSMERYNDAIDQACHMLKGRFSVQPASSKYGLHFVAFAGLGQVRDSNDFRDLKSITGMTSIPQAFQVAVDVAKKRQAKRVALAFVSDGADNDMAACMAAIGRLPPMPCPCRFACVGFQGFPTSLASGRLFELYGSGNHVCEAPVLPCDITAEVQGAFASLCAFIESPDASPPPTQEDVESAPTVDALLELASRAYNASMVQSLYRKTVPEVEAFSACKVILAAVRCKLARHVRVLKGSRSSSVLLTKAIGAGGSDLCRAQDATDAVQSMQSRISSCLDRATSSRLVADLDDETKRLLVGYAARHGKVYAKSLRYRLPDEDRIKKSFVDFIDSYPASSDGMALDTATRAEGMSLYDVVADAKTVLHLVRSFSVVDIVEKMPQFGIPLRLEELSRGAAMNCWLVQVSDAWPGELTTVQALRDRLEEEATNAEDPLDCAGYFTDDCDEPLPPAPLPIGKQARFGPNCLALVPSELPGPDTSYLRFTASYLVYGEPLYNNEALKSVYAATVTHLLQASRFVDFILQFRLTVFS